MKRPEHRRRRPLAVLALVLLGGAAACKESAGPAVPDPPTAPMEPLVRDLLVQTHRNVLADPASEEAWGTYAAALDVHGFLEAAEPCYRRARSLAPEKVRHSYNLAILLEKRGADPDSILELYRFVAQRQPNYPPVHTRIGRILAEKGDLEGAVAAYETALRLDPELHIARRALGRAWIELEQYPKAVTELERVAASVPEDGPTQAALSPAYLRLGDEERSRASGELARTRGDALQLPDPLNFFVVRLGRSAMLAHDRVNGRFAEGDFAGAVEDLKIVLHSHPDDPALHERLAEAYRRLGQSALAEKEAAEARRLRGRN